MKHEYDTRIIYPPAEDIFNAFHFTPLSKVKVMILGQDPYHNENQAHGLSFSVLPTQKDIPPSLVNIYQELHDDLGCYIPNNGYLKKWADQGVLLLNLSLIHISLTPSLSSLLSNISCIPRHIPRKGVPSSTTFLITSTRPYL